jgi:hypothetical protein
MGAHVKRNSTSAPVTAVSRAMGPWPARPSSSKPTKNYPGRQGTQEVVVPDFVSKLEPYLPGKYGYQEVHTRYDDMRKWFAKRATSTHQNEIATIKVTLMSMKPNNKNPQMVMVRILKMIWLVL